MASSLGIRNDFYMKVRSTLFIFNRLFRMLLQERRFLATLRLSHDLHVNCSFSDMGICGANFDSLTLNKVHIYHFLKWTL